MSNKNHSNKSNTTAPSAAPVGSADGLHNSTSEVQNAPGVNVQEGVESLTPATGEGVYTPPVGQSDVYTPPANLETPSVNETTATTPVLNDQSAAHLLATTSTANQSYVVAQGQAVTTLRGILGAGEVVEEADFYTPSSFELLKKSNVVVVKS